MPIARRTGGRTGEEKQDRNFRVSVMQGRMSDPFVQGKPDMKSPPSHRTIGVPPVDLHQMACSAVGQANAHVYVYGKRGSSRAEEHCHLSLFRAVTYAQSNFSVGTRQRNHARWHARDSSTRLGQEDRQAGRLSYASACLFLRHPRDACRTSAVA